ncbi:MAG: hypothetical protein ACR2OB_15315 [Solirubrobacteraceae bacterium]
MLVLPPGEEPPDAELPDGEPPGEEPPVDEPLPAPVPALPALEPPEDPELEPAEPLDEDPDPAEDADPDPPPPVLAAEVAVVADVVATVEEGLAEPVGTVSGGAPDVFAAAEPPPQPLRLVASTSPAVRAANAPPTRERSGTRPLTCSGAACAGRSRGSR